MYKSWQDDLRAICHSQTRAIDTRIQFPKLCVSFDINGLECDHLSFGYIKDGNSLGAEAFPKWEEETMQKKVTKDLGYKVHPSADRYPLMPEDELQELADDIAENGLQEPIVVGKNNVLIDGRNRVLACKLAGVEVKEEVFEGTDDQVIAFIHSRNDYRRHMKPWQRAGVIALDYPEATKLKRKGSGVDFNNLKIKSSMGVYISKCRTIIHKKRFDLMDQIVAGTISGDDALKEIDLDEKKQQSDDYKRDRLRDGAPDLADKVEDGMDIDEALDVMDGRNRRTEEQRSSMLSMAEKAFKAFESFSSTGTLDSFTKALSNQKFQSDLGEVFGNRRTSDLSKGADNFIKIVQLVRKQGK